MQTLPVNVEEHDDPLYVRWPPEQSPYSIEIKLGVLQQIASAVVFAAEKDREAGGLLLGVLQGGSPHPTLRIEEAIVVGPREGAGPAFLLDPNEPQLVRALQLAARDSTTVLGVYRGHRRSGPLQPSLSDRGTISQQLSGRREALLLLAEGKPQGIAKLFITVEGKLGAEPAVAPFALDPQSLAGLPEVPAVSLAADLPPVVPRRGSNRPLYAAMALLVVALIATFYGWSTVPETPQGENLQLTITGTDSLQINWNRSSKFVQRAQKGTIVVAGSQRRRQVSLSGDDLRTGAVEYRSKSPLDSVQLILVMPDGYTVSQRAAHRPEGWQVVSSGAEGD